MFDFYLDLFLANLFASIGPIIIATIDPIMTLSITKRTTEFVGGDNIQKPIMAINPPKNPPIIPHLNRLFNLSKRMCFIISKNHLLGDFFIGSLLVRIFRKKVFDSFNIFN